MVPVQTGTIDRSMKPQPDHPEADVTVLHEASGVVVVLKPGGIATQAPPGIESMERRVRNWLARRGGGYLGVPHRLDRPVSGVMLFALTPRAARQLSRQFERRQVGKRYVARLELVAARDMPGESWADWRDRVAKVPDEPRARIVPADEPCEEAREAVTQVRLLEAARPHDGGEGSVIRVELMPSTGRMHQLRIQAASRGMPVLGDALYGSIMTFQESRPSQEEMPFQGASSGGIVSPIALHASRLEYLDPDTKSPVVVESPPPW